MGEDIDFQCAQIGNRIFTPVPQILPGHKGVGHGPLYASATIYSKPLPPHRVRGSTDTTVASFEVRSLSLGTPTPFLMLNLGISLSLVAPGRRLDV